MKLIKMSLAAVMVMSASAFALENVETSGSAALFYSSQGDDTNDLFSKESAIGETALSLGATADLADGVKSGATMYAISTMGLENNLVGGTWTGGVQDNYWFSEAWVSKKIGETTATAGRMKLDTPLLFTESWSIAPNTFEAATLVNKDIPGTTLVGAYVGKSDAGVIGGGITDLNFRAENNTTAVSDARANIFTQINPYGVYAIGAVNESIEGLALQAWYFSIPTVEYSIWTQADFEMNGIVAGVQYTRNSPDGKDDIDAGAAKVGYSTDALSISAAASMTGDSKTSGSIVGANLAGAGSQSKLYTEAWWNYGIISQANTTAVNVTGTYSIADVVDLGAYFTMAMADKNDLKEDNVKNKDLTELTLEAAKSFGNLDVGLYYIYANVSVANPDKNTKLESASSNTVQAYLTYNF